MVLKSGESTLASCPNSGVQLYDAAHLSKDWGPPLTDLIGVRVLQGRHQEAAELTDAIANGGYPDVVFATNFVGAYTYFGAGRIEDATAALDWVIEERGAPVSYQIAEMYALRGQPDKAFEWLETGYVYRDGGLTYLLSDAYLQPLHDDPRWRPFLEKMNLLEYWDAMPGR